jgi:ABC-type molybdate transport system substrate-binding protein
MIGNLVDLLQIPDKDTAASPYLAVNLKNAPDKQAARDFFKSLESERADSIHKKCRSLPIN